MSRQANQGNQAMKYKTLLAISIVIVALVATGVQAGGSTRSKIAGDLQRRLVASSAEEEMRVIVTLPGWTAFVDSPGR
jgi:hypothetical protein